VVRFFHGNVIDLDDILYRNEVRYRYYESFPDPVVRFLFLQVFNCRMAYCDNLFVVNGCRFIRHEYEYEYEYEYE
jgi:hypothetical protein